MEIIELTEHIKDEDSAIEYLRSKGILKVYESCPYCGCKEYWGIRRRKYKCKGCRREWSIRKGSILDNFKIPFRKFLLSLKLFEMELSALRVSKQLKISYVTALKLYDFYRYMIIKGIEDGNKLGGEIEIDESYFGGRRKGKRGRGATNKIPVFGILEREGRVKVEIVEDVKAERLLELTIDKVKRGSIIYTDCYRSYDTLMMYGFKHRRINHDVRFANGKVYINGIEGFWSYAKERLLKYHGVLRDKFILYLKELEFRYNNRKKDIFDLLLDIINKNYMVAINE
jgi:transposase